MLDGKTNRAVSYKKKNSGLNVFQITLKLCCDHVCICQRKESQKRSNWFVIDAKLSLFSDTVSVSASGRWPLSSRDTTWHAKQLKCWRCEDHLPPSFYWGWTGSLISTSNSIITFQSAEASVFSTSISTLHPRGFTETPHPSHQLSTHF